MSVNVCKTKKTCNHWPSSEMHSRTPMSTTPDCNCCSILNILSK